MTFDETTAVAIIGIATSIVTGVVGWLTARIKSQSPAAIAAARLSEAQATDIVIENLSQQYTETLARLTRVEARLLILDQRFAMAQGIVAGLPDEHRSKFDPVFAPIEVKGV